MTTQSSFSVDKDLGYPGDLADSSFKEVDSHIAGTTIPFGRGVAKRATESDADDEVGMPTQATDVTARFRGVALRDHTVAQPGVGFVANEMLPVVKRGEVWVEAEGTIARDAAVYCRHTASGGNTDLGKFRVDADSNTAALVPSARVVKGRTGAGLIQIEINLP